MCVLLTVLSILRMLHCTKPLTVPTSAPLDVSVDDVNDSSLTIKWKTPETIGDSGLDGYAIEYCKDGSKSAYVCHMYVRVFACTCPQRVRGQIYSLLGLGRIRQASVYRLSLYLPTPLLEALICSDDGMPSEISSR